MKAEGRTVMRGIGEMRVKESDRIALMAAGLEACGAIVEEEPEEAEPRSATGGPQSGPQRPQREPITLRSLLRRIFRR